MTTSEFDAFADDYESALQQGLNVSGESADYFAEKRVQWLKRRMKQWKYPTDSLRVLDFGCGTGNSVAYLQNLLSATHVTGLDTSEKSLETARARYNPNTTSFATPEAFEAKESIDLVYCNGVFHHIPLEARAEAFDLILKSLRPGGLFAFWENNPWNPGTRIVMSRIPFDRDAITIPIPEAKVRLEKAGFQIVGTDTCFYFPKILAWFRPLEPMFCKIPFGAQYLVLARKP